MESITVPQCPSATATPKVRRRFYRKLDELRRWAIDTDTFKKKGKTAPLRGEEKDFLVQTKITTEMMALDRDRMVKLLQRVINSERRLQKTHHGSDSRRKAEARKRERQLRDQALRRRMRGSSEKKPLHAGAH